MSVRPSTRGPRPAFVDSNLLVHAFDESGPADIRGPALALVRAGFEGRARLAVSNQVLGEMVHTMTKQLRARRPARDPWSIAEDFVLSMNWMKLEYTTTTLSEAARLSRQHRIPTWDAVLVATMFENGISRLYTENESDFERVPDLEVVNPVEAGTDE
ncbi:MAG TPA: PIN domain-containing protein [Thermoplasmata archaeon]|nr:PIN domain-containing protein [Thermoplasmata archaeon]